MNENTTTEVITEAATEVITEAAKETLEDSGTGIGGKILVGVLGIAITGGLAIGGYYLYKKHKKKKFQGEMESEG